MTTITAEAAFFGYPPRDEHEPDRDDLVRYLMGLEAKASGNIEQVVGSVDDLTASVGGAVGAIGLVVAPAADGGGAYKWTDGASWDLIGPLPTVLTATTLGPEIDAALTELRAIRDGLRAPSAVAGNPGSQPAVAVDPETGDVVFTIPVGQTGGDGEPGQSAYQVWLGQGNIGDENDFHLSLKGEPGAPGGALSPDDYADSADAEAGTGDGIMTAQLTGLAIAALAGKKLASPQITGSVTGSAIATPQDMASEAAGKLVDAKQFAAALPVETWVNFRGTGALAVRGSSNISSIVDNGVGNYTLNFITPFPNGDYAGVVTTNAGASFTFFSPVSPSSAAVQIRNTSQSLIDVDGIYVGVFG